MREASREAHTESAASVATVALRDVRHNEKTSRSNYQKTPGCFHVERADARAEG